MAPPSVDGSASDNPCRTALRHVRVRRGAGSSRGGRWSRVLPGRRSRANLAPLMGRTRATRAPLVAPGLSLLQSARGLPPTYLARYSSPTRQPQLLTSAGARRIAIRKAEDLVTTGFRCDDLPAGSRAPQTTSRIQTEEARKARSENSASHASPTADGAGSEGSPCHQHAAGQRGAGSANASSRSHKGLRRCALACLSARFVPPMPVRGWRRRGARTPCSSMAWPRGQGTMHAEPGAKDPAAVLVGGGDPAVAPDLVVAVEDRNVLPALLEVLHGRLDAVVAGADDGHGMRPLVGLRLEALQALRHHTPKRMAGHIRLCGRGLVCSRPGRCRAWTRHASAGAGVGKAEGPPLGANAQQRASERRRSGTPREGGKQTKRRGRHLYTRGITVCGGERERRL